jgi:hypothetical protein
MQERDDHLEAAPQQQRDNVSAARDAMNILPLLDRAAVFVEPLLNDREEMTLALATMLGSIRVLSMRLSDREREVLAQQMCVEARRVLLGYLH